MKEELNIEYLVKTASLYMKESYEYSSKQHNSETHTKLILPKNNKKLRLSEQEFKQSFIHAFMKVDLFGYSYSVETPTNFKYKFSVETQKPDDLSLLEIENNTGNSTMISENKGADTPQEENENQLKQKKYTSARIDVSIYYDSMLKHHIEFKSQNPDIKDIAKDFLKLYNEPNDQTPYNHYYLHVVESFDEYTRLSLLGKFIKSLSDMSRKQLLPHDNTIQIYVFCVTDNKLYHFSSDELMSCKVNENLMLKYGDKFHCGYSNDIIYMISRYRNMMKPKSEDKHLHDEAKSITKKGEYVLNLSEEYWKQKVV